MATVIGELVAKYKQFVTSNPETVGSIESSLRILSYVIPGQKDNSGALSELLYSAAGLLALLNDAILRKAANIKLKVPLCHSKLVSWLTIIDYVEVFLEIAAAEIWGEYGKWCVVVCLHLLKAAIKYIMLFKYNSGIQTSPMIPPLKRAHELKKAKELQQKQEEEQVDMNTLNSTENVVTLRRSGRVIRTLAASPQNAQRSWQVPGSKNKKKSEEEEPTVYIPTILDTRRKIAEVLHIARPLTHLMSMYIFGKSSWTPLAIAGGVDVSSMCLMGEPESLNPMERKEMKRRTTMLLLYLLRSPLYDKHTKTKLIYLLQKISGTIPLSRLIINPLLEYLPTWQKIYFYVWTQ